MNEEQFKLSLLQQLSDKSPSVLSLLQKYRTANRKYREYHSLVNFIHRDLRLTISFNRLSEVDEMPNYSITFGQLAERDALNLTFFGKSDFSNKCIRLYYEESITVKNGILCFGVYECKVYREDDEFGIVKNIATPTLYYDPKYVYLYYPQDVDAFIESVRVLRKTSLHYSDLVIDETLKSSLEGLLNSMKPESDAYQSLNQFYEMCLGNLTVDSDSFLGFCVDFLNTQCKKFKNGNK